MSKEEWEEKSGIGMPGGDLQQKRLLTEPIGFLWKENWLLEVALETIELGETCQH